MAPSADWRLVKEIREMARVKCYSTGQDKCIKHQNGTILFDLLLTQVALKTKKLGKIISVFLFARLLGKRKIQENLEKKPYQIANQKPKKKTKFQMEYKN